MSFDPSLLRNAADAMSRNAESAANSAILTNTAGVVVPPSGLTSDAAAMAAGVGAPHAATSAPFGAMPSSMALAHARANALRAQQQEEELAVRVLMERRVAQQQAAAAASLGHHIPFGYAQQSVYGGATLGASASALLGHHPAVLGQSAASILSGHNPHSAAAALSAAHHQHQALLGATNHAAAAANQSALLGARGYMPFGDVELLERHAAIQERDAALQERRDLYAAQAQRAQALAASGLAFVPQGAMSAHHPSLAGYAMAGGVSPELAALGADEALARHLAEQERQAAEQQSAAVARAQQKKADEESSFQDSKPKARENLSDGPTLTAYSLFFSDERERILAACASGDGDSSDDDEEEEGKVGGEDEDEDKRSAKVPASLNFQELTRKIAQRWKTLPEQQRKHYQQLADEDAKRQYEAMGQDFEDYKESSERPVSAMADTSARAESVEGSFGGINEFQMEASSLSRIRARRAIKDPSAPKRPGSAFLLFSNGRRKQLKRDNPDATNAELSKMLSKIWADAPDNVRQKYLKESQDLGKQYRVDIAEWRRKKVAEEEANRSQRESGLDASGRPIALNVASGNHSHLLGLTTDSNHSFLYGDAAAYAAEHDEPEPRFEYDSDDSEAPKRPMSAFLAFSNKRRKALKRQNPFATNSDLSKMLSKTWKDAPEVIREKYLNEAAILSDQYKEAIAKWKKKHPGARIRSVNKSKPAGSTVNDTNTQSIAKAVDRGVDEDAVAAETESLGEPVAGEGKKLAVEADEKTSPSAESGAVDKNQQVPSREDETVPERQDSEHEESEEAVEVDKKPPPRREDGRDDEAVHQPGGNDGQVENVDEEMDRSAEEEKSLESDHPKAASSGNDDTSVTSKGDIKQQITTQFHAQKWDARTLAHRVADLCRIYKWNEVQPATFECYALYREPDLHGLENLIMRSDCLETLRTKISGSQVDSLREELVEDFVQGLKLCPPSSFELNPSDTGSAKKVSLSKAPESPLVLLAKAESAARCLLELGTGDQFEQLEKWASRCPVAVQSTLCDLFREISSSDVPLKSRNEAAKNKCVENIYDRFKGLRTKELKKERESLIGATQGAEPREDNLGVKKYRENMVKLRKVCVELRSLGVPVVLLGTAAGGEDDDDSSKGEECEPVAKAEVDSDIESDPEVDERKGDNIKTNDHEKDKTSSAEELPEKVTKKEVEEETADAQQHQESGKAPPSNKKRKADSAALESVKKSDEKVDHKESPPTKSEKKEGGGESPAAKSDEKVEDAKSTETKDEKTGEPNKKRPAPPEHAPKSSKKARDEEEMSEDDSQSKPKRASALAVLGGKYKRRR